MVTKDLGMVTAYAYAVAGGYTGTEAEFTQLMADLAVVVDDFDNFSVNVTTLPAGSSATASYADGVLSLGIPKGDKGDTGNTGATGATPQLSIGTVETTAEPSVTITGTVDNPVLNFGLVKGDKGDTGEVSEAELTQAFEDFSANGTVANAEQLTTDIRANDQTPYLFRTAGGSVDIGDREYINGIVGGTVAFNQLVANSGSVSVAVPSGHKYFSSIGGTKAIATSNGSAISATGGTDNIIDLTQMFGSTIADYIYALETANAGAGVAWIKSHGFLTKPYYAYNAGELKSVKALRHITRGFNAFDKSAVTPNTWFSDPDGTTVSQSGYNVSDFIPILPNTTYYKLGNGSGRNLFYDANKVVLPNQAWNNISSGPYAFTTPANAYFVRFTVTNATLDAFGLNLRWDGERDGEYEEYVEHVYELDSDLELRGIPKLTAGNDLYYDGDVYEADGTVTRKYGIVDLGTLNWSRNATNQFYAPLPTAGTQYTGNQICTKYQASARGAYDANVDKCVTVTGSNCWVRDSAYDVTADFKASLNGVYLVYELATPTTETADPYTNPQIVDDFGTEEYVTTSIVPVGHNTDYPVDLKAKLEMAPNSPSQGNGDYIVRQTNGTNEYVPLVIEEVLPQTPSSNGTYSLTLTVANGEATLSWT